MSRKETDHALIDPPYLQRKVVLTLGVTIIRVMDQTRPRLPFSTSFLKCLHHQGSLECGVHVVTDDAPGEQVHHTRQVEPTFASWDIRDVTNPLAIGGVGCEVLSQDILCHRMTGISLCGDEFLGLDFGLNAMFVHESCDSMASTGVSLLIERLMHAWASIGLVAFLMYLLDAFQQLLVFHLSLADRALLPRVVATTGHFEHLTHEGDAELLPMLVDELVSHRIVCEKMVTAFFSISRSWGRR